MAKEIKYGADVINRIIEQGKTGGVKRLKDAVVRETIEPLITKLCEISQIFLCVKISLLWTNSTH